jgi:ribosomal-protein-alanine N-acetyltransferase
VTPVALRAMTSADLPGILELEHALFGEEAWSVQMLEGELAQQPASRHYLVAQDDAAIAGYGGLLAAGTQADILTLAVAADHWGRGIGSSLLAALLAEAQRRSCREVFLEVRIDNARAQRLYRRYGFEQIGIRKGYYQPSGVDALVMRRRAARLAPGSGVGLPGGADSGGGHGGADGGGERGGRDSGGADGGAG